MIHQYNGEYGYVKLCPMEEKYIEEMRLLRNECRNAFVYSKEISQEEQERWYQKYLNTEGDYVFSVFFEGNWIGAVALYDLQGTAIEFGRLMISRKNVDRKGLGVEVTKCACNIAFEQLGVESVRLVVYADNVSAVKTYLKAGFVTREETTDTTNKKMFLMELNQKGK